MKIMSASSPWESDAESGWWLVCLRHNIISFTSSKPGSGTERWSPNASQKIPSSCGRPAFFGKAVTACQIAARRWLIEFGLRLCALHTFVAVSCCSSDAGRGRPKLEKREEKSRQLDSMSRTLDSENFP